MDHVLGKGKILSRVLVLSSGAIWIALTVYAYLPLHLTYFAQSSCKEKPAISRFFVATPIVAAIGLGEEFSWVGIVAASPLILIALGWIVAIILRRHYIWPKGESYRPKFATVWCVSFNAGRRFYHPIPGGLSGNIFPSSMSLLLSYSRSHIGCLRSKLVYSTLTITSLRCPLARLVEVSRYFDVGHSWW
jgi:hypothetical protein